MSKRRYANHSFNFKNARRIAKNFLCEGALDVNWDHLICQNPQLDAFKISIGVAAVAVFVVRHANVRTRVSANLRHGGNKKSAKL
jgi:hypothetical protein